jgi:superfamily II DNA or RNA helicase
MIKFDGTVYFLDDSKKTLVVDAQPHIMARLRRLFENSRNFHAQGKYTHKPITFPGTLSACRDIIWLMDRYRFDCNEECLSFIQNKSKEYDDIVLAVEDADNDPVYKVSPQALKLALPLREHQIKFSNMFKKVKRMLLADPIGLGKTASALSILCEPESRPAIIIVPTHLCTQWEIEAKRFLPDITTHVIRGFLNYPLPKVDVIITSYNRLKPWQDVLLDNSQEFNSVIFDEVHELRHQDTLKRELSQQISDRAKQVVGLSGTPIFNMGSEIWSVLDVIKKDCLGEFADFSSEWCNMGAVSEPATLNSYLKKQGLMLRRTPEEAGLFAHTPSKNVVTIDADLNKLKEFQDVAKMLALSVLSGNVGEDSESSRSFDFKLRHATGVAKSKPVSEFVKMILESEEKIVLVGWHHDVYDVWLKELEAYKLVKYTGDESSKEKDQAVKDFIEGDARIFIISLRSGSGLDGLQRVCNTIVIGELDYSPHVMDQVIGRLARDGQTKHVQAYILTIADGADPFMMGRNGEKRSQHDGLIEGKDAEANLLADVSGGLERVREMAKAYLISIGEEIPEAVPEIGLLGDLAKLLRRLKIPNNNEEEMQVSLHNIFKDNLDPSILVYREFSITKRSRLDFLIEKGDERIAIECKIDSTKRAEVYRQVRRYVEEGNITSLILLAPWHGISSFKVDGIPVIVVDTSVNQI